MIQACFANTVAYQVAWEWQKKLVKMVDQGQQPDTLLLLEHPHVITLGRAADPAHVLIDSQERAAKGIELLAIDRGGDVTYHGPGQLVGYPIFSLQKRGNDPRRYLRDVEEVLIRTLSHFGLVAERMAPYTGVWVNQRKIAAIGVKMNRGRQTRAFITSHGFALNVHPDLEYFQHIIPCGIEEYGVTSMKEEGVNCTLEEVVERLLKEVEVVFGQPVHTRSLELLFPLEIS